MPQHAKRAETDSLVSLHARAMSHARWAKCDDPSAATAPARAAAEERFIRQAREFGDLPDDELARRARHLKRAYFTKLAMASAKARRKARQAGDDDAAA